MESRVSLQNLIILNRRFLFEFLSKYYTFLIKATELIAVLTGLILYKKYKHTDVKYFIWFLIYVVIIETVGSYPVYLKSLNLSHLIENTLIRRNYWRFAFTWVSASTFFYSWFLGKQLKSSVFKKILRYACIVYLVVLIVRIGFYHEEYFKGRNLILDIGNMTIVLLSSIFYLYEILNSEKILDFYRSFYFYVAAIIFIWWLVITPIGFFEQYNNVYDMNFVMLKYVTKLCLISFMYLGFSVALIISKVKYD